MAKEVDQAARLEKLWDERGPLIPISEAIEIIRDVARSQKLCQGSLVVQVAIEAAVQALEAEKVATFSPMSKKTSHAQDMKAELRAAIARAEKAEAECDTWRLIRSLAGGRVIRLRTELERSKAKVEQLADAIQAAIDCGMIPKTSAAEGGAARYAQQVKVADQLRSALAAARKQEWRG